MNNNVYIVWDTETTGLNIGEHEVVQIAAKAYHPRTLEPMPDGEFSILLKPNNPEKASQGAIDVIGKELFERAKTEGIDQKVGWKTFFEWVAKYNKDGKGWSKPIPVGHNISGFDMRWAWDAVTRYKLGKTADDCPFSGRPIDTWHMFFNLYENDPDVNKYTLDSLCSLLQEDKRTTANHDAIEDVRLTGKCFVRFMRLFRRFHSKINIVPTNNS